MFIKIASLNINGFNKSSSSLANFITKHNIHICCIQETHTIQTHELEHFCHKHNLDAYPNTDQSHTPHIKHRQGTIFIINTKHLHLTPNNIQSHVILHNYIQSITVTIQNIIYTIINCYFPSGNTTQKASKRYKTIQKISSFLNNLDYKNRIIILAGDFNLILDPNDRTGNFNPNSNDKIIFQKLLSDFDLTDTYRAFYPNTLTYSFSRSRPTSRLDRIYISSSQIQNISPSTYSSITFSDHNKSPNITLKTPSTIPFRSSHWKLNDSILNSANNIFSIKTKINHLSTPPNPIQDPLLWWDKFKTNIKQYTIHLSKINNRKLLTQQNRLNTTLQHSNTQQGHKQNTDIWMQLTQIQQYKQTGTQIRSRIPPLTSIDEPSPMATIKETINQNKSLIPPDTNHSHPTNSSPSTSFQSFISFFQDLWNPSIPSPDPTEYLCRLSPLTNKEILQILPPSPLITPEEIRFAIKTLNNHSSPGLDGFTAQFYNSLPSLIPLLNQSFNNAFIRKQLSSSQSVALIKLIPKIPKPTSVKDWRPIALLNTDYKILSSIISNRLKPILNSIISPEQQCGLPNRQIFNNHLNILSAINYSKDFQQPLAIVQFDFYKAFDSISHTFLLKTASKLGIPDSLLTWIQIFLSNLSAKLNLNGYLSDSISVKRGIRQGCPLSMHALIYN